MSFEDDKVILFKKFRNSEAVTTYLSKDNRIYFTGRKLYYYPKLFDIDYTRHKVKEFCAVDRGSAVLTEENRIFYNGNFWSKKIKNTDRETGIKEVDVEEEFKGKEILSLGGKYSIKYAIVNE